MAGLLDLMAPDPNIVRRGTLIPYGYDKTGRGQMTYPGLLIDAAKSFDNLGTAMRLPGNAPVTHPAYKSVFDAAGTISLPSLLSPARPSSTVGMNLFDGGIHDLGRLGAEHLKRRWGLREDNIGLNLSKNRHDQKSAYLTGPFGEFRISDHYNNPNFNFNNANAVNPSARKVVRIIDELMNMKNAVVSKGNKIVDDWEIPLNAIINKLKPDWQDDLMYVKKSGTKTAYQKRKDAFLSKHNVTGEEFNKLLSPKPNYRKGELYTRQGKNLQTIE